jgi:transcriptional regulator with XRE-family HTH domain
MIGDNAELVVPDLVYDFGGLLRTLRNNHGYTVGQLSKRIGLTPYAIGKIERSESNLPSETILKEWFVCLGCKRETVNKLLLAARVFRVKHYVTLVSREKANPDIIRLLEAYRQDALTDYDRALLSLVARDPLPKEIKTCEKKSLY